MRWQRLSARWLTVILGLAIVAGTRPLPAQVAQGSIVGTLHVMRGNFPSSPVMVTLQARGALVGSVYCDNEGRFGFNLLEANAYHVIIDDHDYQRLEERVIVDPVSPVRILNLTLVPRIAEKNAGAPAISGGNANLSDPAQYTRQIPKDARREFERGMKSQRDGKSDEALRHFRKAIELSPDFYAARNNLGSAYVAKSQFQDAREQFEKVVKISPNDAAGYFNLANVYLLEKNYERAQQWILQGLRRERDSGFGQFLQGSVYFNTGKLREAEAALRRSLQLSPLMSNAHLALVNLYLQEKRNEDAVSELRQFLQQFPEDPLAPKAKGVLEKLAPGPAKSQN